MNDIFTPTQCKALDDSIGLHGRLNKSFVSMEECAELIQAISKIARVEADALREGMNYKTAPDAAKHLDNLVEEVADVLICIQMLQLMYSFTDEEIEGWIDYKIKRQEKRDEEQVQELRS